MSTHVRSSIYGKCSKNFKRFYLTVLKYKAGYQGTNSQNACQSSKQCRHRSVCTVCYPQTKSEGYRFGGVRPSIPSIHTFCLSGTISQYLLVRFDSFLVQMISTIYSRYPISLVKIDPLTLELLSLFWYRQL